MTRRLLNFLTWLSLLLLLGVTVLTVRSFWNYEAVTVRWNPTPTEPTSSGHVVCFTSWPGQIWLNLVIVPDADPAFWRAGGNGPAVEVGSFRWGRRRSGRKPSFRWNRSEDAPSVLDDGAAAHAVYRTVVVPYWSMMLLTAALPLVRLRAALAALRRTGNAARGQCVHCGYDLTGNVSGMCPECGQVI